MLFPIVFTATFAFVLSDSTGTVEQLTKKERESLLHNLALANNEFSFKLLRSLQRDKNIFISPFSVHVALAMVLQGARNLTAEGIEKALCYDVAEVHSKHLSRNFKGLLLFLKSETEHQLKIANAIITQTDFPILKEYLLTMKNDFYALVKNVSFKTDRNGLIKEINDWVKNATDGKITTILKEFDRETKIVVLNAIFFKGVWEFIFDQNKTKDRTFYNNNVTPVKIPTMTMQTNKLSYKMDKNFHAVSLPYKGNDVEMIIIRPLRGYSLKNIRLSADILDKAISSMSKINLNLRLPKFTLEDSLNLNDNLKSLGMENAFTKQANFSGINNDTQLYISKVVHKAMIEVNEQGSVAAASTAVVVNSRERPIKFFCNRPFLFIIRDRRTNMNLFMGQVNKL